MDSVLPAVSRGSIHRPRFQARIPRVIGNIRTEGRGLPSVLIIFIKSFVVFKNVHTGLCLEKTVRLWSHDVDLTPDQRFGHLLSSTWCFGYCAHSFSAAPFGLFLGGGTLFDERNTSFTTNQEQRHRPFANQHPVKNSHFSKCTTYACDTVQTIFSLEPNMTCRDDAESDHKTKKENNSRLSAHKSATSARTDSPQRMLEKL